MGIVHGTDLERVSSWARPKLQIRDNTIGDVNLARYCPLKDSGLDFQLESSSLGDLDFLPAEIICRILVRLDFFSLDTFRRVSKQGHTIVSRLPELNLIKRQCPDVLRAVIGTSARHFDLFALHKTLCSSRCTTCQSFGGYFHLLGCVRVCYDCFTELDIHLPVHELEAAWVFGFRPGDVEMTTYINTIPGFYTTARTCQKRRLLWDQATLSRLRKSDTLLNPRNRDRLWAEPRRFMVVIPAPLLDPTTVEPHWGVHCLGCSYSHKPGATFRTQYTPQGFLKHISDFGPVLVEDPVDRSRHAPIVEVEA
ncbi:hypothetical protein QBC35DRAFT_60514 [Podospora australis]|uniref:F-box domain-containing protein n=1 Tax=Podospora australis TaxID=1536484 RepID=A0AAN7AD76_9PEZI|nr:hypothetical protein QBC35DRAFT_60514 [Podospora australis]